MSPQSHQRGLLIASAPPAQHLPHPQPLCTPEHSTEKNPTAPNHTWIHQEPTPGLGRGCTSSLSHPCHCPDSLLMPLLSFDRKNSLLEQISSRRVLPALRNLQIMAALQLPQDLGTSWNESCVSPLQTRLKQKVSYSSKNKNKMREISRLLNCSHLPSNTSKVCTEKHLLV